MESKALALKIRPKLKLWTPEYLIIFLRNHTMFTKQSFIQALAVILVMPIVADANNDVVCLGNNYEQGTQLGDRPYLIWHVQK